MALWGLPRVPIWLPHRHAAWYAPVDLTMLAQPTVPEVVGPMRPCSRPVRA